MRARRELDTGPLSALQGKVSVFYGPLSTTSSVLLLISFLHSVEKETLFVLFIGKGVELHWRALVLFAG